MPTKITVNGKPLTTNQELTMLHAIRDKMTELHTIIERLKVKGATRGVELLTAEHADLDELNKLLDG